jgi:hypothetical protein
VTFLVRAEVYEGREPSLPLELGSNGNRMAFLCAASREWLKGGGQDGSMTRITILQPICGADAELWHGTARGTGRCWHIPPASEGPGSARPRAHARSPRHRRHEL